MTRGIAARQPQYPRLAHSADIRVNVHAEAKHATQCTFVGRR